MSPPTEELSDSPDEPQSAEGGLRRGESFRSSVKSRASADSTLTSTQDNKKRVLEHLEKYYHETHFTRQTSDDQQKQTAQRCILPRNFIVPRSSVKRSLQIMDQRDTPDCPGEVKLGELLKAVDRFNRAFGEKKHPNWDVELMEDWSVSWNRSPIYSRFCVQLGQLERSVSTSSWIWETTLRAFPLWFPVSSSPLWWCRCPASSLEPWRAFACSLVLGWKSINVFLLSHRGWPWPKKFVCGSSRWKSSYAS